MSEIKPEKGLTLASSQAAANLASICGVTPMEVAAVLQNMIMKGASGAEMIAFAQVCHAYRLDPLKKEIFAYKDKAGIWRAGLYFDGWITIINRHPQFDWMEHSFVMNETNGKPFSCTVTIHRKDRVGHPTIITEYFDEVRQASEHWIKQPFRQTRHKAIIQCGRVCFGFAGLTDFEEYRDAGLVVDGMSGRSNVRVLNERLGVAKPGPQGGTVIDVEPLAVDEKEKPPEGVQGEEGAETAPEPSEPPVGDELAQGEPEKPPMELSPEDCEFILGGDEKKPKARRNRVS